MKTSNIHATLSDVYRLLSTHASEDFARAGDYRGLTPHLREALRALSREAGKGHAGGKSSETGASRDIRTRRPRSPVGPRQKGSIVSMFSRDPRFATTLSILQFASEAGLSIEPRPKESRERLAGIVADAILQQTGEKQSQILSWLFGRGYSQTEGWINAIKGSRA